MTTMGEVETKIMIVALDISSNPRYMTFLATLMCITTGNMMMAPRPILHIQTRANQLTLPDF